MDPDAAASRRRAEQWLSVAEKLLVARDLEGCKQFASQALSEDPYTPGADDLHAAAATLLAAQRSRLPNGQPDPYAVLGMNPANPASRHPDAIHSHYRRLAFLLNRSRPDRPYSLAFADAARLVADAWAFLSDPVLKSSLDSELDAVVAAAAAARVFHPPAPNRPQPQSLLPAQSTRPSATTPSPRPIPPQVAPALRPTPPPAAPSQRLTPQLASTPPRPTPPPVASPPRPTPPPVAPQTWPTPPASAPSPTPTPPPQVVSQTRSTPPPPAAQIPVAGTVPLAASGAFWTVCTACSHIHQYERHYETCKMLCPSCRQPFVAEEMAEPPPIVPGTDMYYCTWGFFPVGFPGCPGFERIVNSQPQGPDQLNTPWLGSTGGVKGNAGNNAENGVPVSVAVDVPVEAAVTPPAKPMRVKVGAKKRGRPKGSKNKKKL